ncbi:MAG: hypothetical protein Q9216_005816 [Gyalolechia sp. 2 TL-2023]
MKTPWTRIIRTQIARCRCSQKQFARSASTALVARKSATVPRRLGLKDVCTAFFSTIVFASTIADGNRKSARQGKLVNAIKDAENDLKALKADQERRISNLTRPVQACLASYDVEKNVSEPQTWQEVFTWAEGEMQERRALGYEHWYGMPLDVLREASVSQIQDFQKLHRHCFPRVMSLSGPEVWNSITWPLHIKKTKTLEYSIAALTLEMMAHATELQEVSSSYLPERANKVFSRAHGKSGRSKHSQIIARLYTLKKSSEKEDFYYEFPSPRYPRYDMGQMLKPNGAHKLNADLHALFESTASDPWKIAQSVPRICLFLLESKAPPDIHTYNLLLSQFAGHNLDLLVEDVLQSVEDTNIRLNELTLAEIIRYYVRTGQSARFDRYVERMNGFGIALEVASPYVDIPDLLKFKYRVRVLRRGVGGEVSNEYYDYAQLTEAELRAMERGGRVKLYEKPRRNLAVYQALIQGALSFRGMSEAMNHYRAMINDGWEPNKEILLSILQHCLVEGDWDAGIATWTRLQRCHASDDEGAYMLMLQLCQKMDRYDLTQELLRHGVARSILPPTVLEMGWHVPSQYEINQNANKALIDAKNIWTLQQGLEDLVREQRAMDESVFVDVERVNRIASAIETSVPFPSLETIALLHEARILSSSDYEPSELYRSLRDSGVRILSMVNELQDIQLFIRVLNLEAQLEKASFAMIRYMKDFGISLFSMCLRSLEDCMNSASTSIIQLQDDFQTRKLCIDVNRLSSWYTRIEEQTHLFRQEKASIDNHLFRPLVRISDWGMTRLIRRVDATVAEGEESFAGVRRCAGQRPTLRLRKVQWQPEPKIRFAGSPTKIPLKYVSP